MDQKFDCFFCSVRNSLRDLLPIIIVIAFFQIAILQEPIPNLGKLLIGTLLVAMGLTFFVRGLEMGLFPIGESIAYGFARKGSLMWLLLFAFALGFGTTIAEPALIAVADEAAEVAAVAGVVPKQAEALARYALGLRMTVALAVGFAIVLGVIRILKGWPIHYLIIGGYIGVSKVAQGQYRGDGTIGTKQTKVWELPLERFPLSLKGKVTSEVNFTEMLREPGKHTICSWISTYSKFGPESWITLDLETRLVNKSHSVED